MIPWMGINLLNLGIGILQLYFSVVNSLTSWLNSLEVDLMLSIQQWLNINLLNSTKTFNNVQAMNKALKQFLTNHDPL